MRRLWMHTLAGQLIAIMLLALGLSYAITYFISHSERESAIFQIRREDCVSRTASLASLLLHTPEDVHQDILRSVNSPWNRFWITSVAPADPILWQRSAREHLLAVRVRGSSAKGGTGSGSIPEERPLFDRYELADTDSQWEKVRTSQRGASFDGQFLALHQWNGMGMVLRLKDDLFVNAVVAKPREMVVGNSNLLVAFVVSALTLSLASVLVARRVSRPLRRLTHTAERLGRGDDPCPIPQEGPEDIRSTAVALNRMQARLRRFVEDRTNMLAAISHDLRTPITSLRLRAEFIQEPEMKDKVIATLEELQQMVDATLAFARDESHSNGSRLIELNSLLASVCDDLAEIGSGVEFEEAPRTPYRCRPEALRRAVRNVIENAVRYGKRARVSLEQTAETLDIIVDDDGPGIPEAEQERVFAPFVRLEASRNRDTGGVGLGLSIARTVVHAHGGEIVLANRPEGGLRVRIRLPSSN